MSFALYNSGTMSPFRHATLYLAEYISLESARAESGLSAEELSRAMVLGLIASAEIGNSAFVERGSLLSYLAQRGNIQKNIEPSEHLPLSSVRPDWSFEENNHHDAKEKGVFRDALVRDETTQKRTSLAPFMFIGLVAVLVLVLSVPSPRDDESRSPVFASQAEINAFTYEQIRSFLARSHETQSSASLAHAQLTFASEGFSAGDQQVAAVAELSDPISSFIQEITARMHELIGTLWAEIVASAYDFVRSLFGK